jgi:hypothetical protein
MNAVQLDECIDSNRLVKSCKQQGLVEAKRFPKHLKTREARHEKKQKDNLVLPMLWGFGNPILTTDFPIDYDNTAVFQGSHPGVIIISNPKPTPTPRVSNIENTIRKFKKEIPTWNVLAWDNSIVEITTEWVEIRCVLHGTPEKPLRLAFSDPVWKEHFLARLELNSKKTGCLPAPTVPPGQRTESQPPPQTQPPT